MPCLRLEESKSARQASASYVRYSKLMELIFEIRDAEEGGYYARALGQSIITEGDTWEELRANVKEATEAYFYDGPKPQAIRLHLVRDELLTRG